MAILGVATLALAFAFVAQPEGFVPLFDADLNRLTMNRSEAHCAAVGFVATNGPAAAANCRDEDNRTTNTDLVAVVPEFCIELVTTLTLTYDECLSIMYDMQYWPTYDGDITNSWTRSAPYPLSILATPGAGPAGGRTGDRQDIQRP